MERQRRWRSAVEVAVIVSIRTLLLKGAVSAQDLPYTSWAVLGDTAYFQDAKLQLYKVGPNRNAPQFLPGFPLGELVVMLASAIEDKIYMVHDLGSVQRGIVNPTGPSQMVTTSGTGAAIAKIASKADGVSFVLAGYRIIFAYD
ncbi:hypothetical protein HDU97_004534 [Phlyctochytrium planicorne]|nr:hypothetical protein HDU97_004534 [Phlyctochytrium planicorne]